MASEDFILIEEAIRHTNSQNLLNNTEFTESYKTIEENALANIFINHKTIHQILAKFVSPEIKKTISQLASYSNWTDLDLSLKSSDIELNGYSLTKDSSDNFLNIFRGQEAQKLTIDKAIPANASYFVAINLKNTSTFIDQNESYLRANGNFYPREMSLIEFRKKTNVDPVKLIKELGATQFAGVYTNINKSNPTQNRFFVTELTNPGDTKEKFAKAVAEFGRSSIGGPDKLHSEYTVNGKNSFDIYNLPISNMAESLFGRAFSGIDGEYFVFFRKYLIWGDNLPGLKNYLQSLASEKTMANDSIYKVYSKSGQTNPNFYMYAKVPKVFRLKDNLLKPEISAKLAENEDIDGNGSLEYLFAEGKKLTVFASDGKKLFEHSFSDMISETPFVCEFGPGNNKIGIVVGGANKVYLLEKNGSVTRGFPLDGNTSFILGKFNDATTWNNLIVGGEGNTLINYRLE